MGNRVIALLSGLLFFLQISTSAQLAEADIESYKAEAKDMVGFLTYLMNNMGNPEISPRDKEVIVTQSFKKVFRDGKVQIEDDLDEERNVITNKDVQAYLKDIDFFFKSAKFNFDIESIESEETSNGELFFKINTTRALQATSIDGEPINNTQPRYIEINVDPENRDLKVVSIYTNQYDRSKYLTTWWQELSYEWRSIFKKKLSFNTDSLTSSQISQVASIQSLDVSGNTYINSIAPLSELVTLKMLNVENTSIEDITPLRNLTDLEYLNLSNTHVKDLEPLKYSNNLEELVLENTEILDLKPLQRLSSLQNLNVARTEISSAQHLKNVTTLKKLTFSNTKLQSLSGIESLNKLVELRLESTSVMQLDALSGLDSLTYLYIDSTWVSDISPLSNAHALEVLSMNNCNVTSLKPLENLKSLKKVYCDNTGIRDTKAKAFMGTHPQALVVYDSEDLLNWWSGLSPDWKSVLRSAAGISASPTKDDLAKVTFIDSLDISGKSIATLDPILNLDKISYLKAANTRVSRLEPLIQLRELKYLDLGNTDITSIYELSRLNDLEALKINDTQVNNLAPVNSLKKLKLLDINNTEILTGAIKAYLDTHPECLVLYKTNELKEWWANLPEPWKEVMNAQINISTTATGMELHKLTQLKYLQFSDTRISDLKPLEEFTQLREVSFEKTSVTDLHPLRKLSKLKRLKASKSPIASLEPISILTLQQLDVSNTRIESLEPLEDMASLEELDCSGTQIRKLDGLENLMNLHTLNCSNTDVKKLSEVEHLRIQYLSCFNTRISDNRLEDFVEENPDCNVTFY